ncbi:glycosyltransferase family 2 protein [archaeon]|jgi:cellulose synthase/poly-beta-1,6-N-acetylglucosamine synthase-like glycosyltransferase|nr:glycosyltransferase family 2 protein [archaeon]MBT4373114.1 glycosyltransferase family 2 protein [archaeon]MBT4531459.1 glycosyltransferase family 2 protein [archaeon]MBT7001363.1 glycosyltransferase family 2 protein [archaeon]MBT7282151.1 glycosyltransferase family 2 protein [archaeon]
MIDVLINSYNEPKSTLRAVNTFLKQYSGKDMRVIVIDPFEEARDFLKKQIKDSRFHFFLDPGEGKSYSLNLIFQEFGSDNPEDIFISTDGDVHVSENAIQEILKAFEDKKIGAITAQPISLDSKKTKYGFWSHFLFNGIHKVRKKLSDKQKFFECSGYLFAIRKGIILDFPLEASEDSIIPYLFWKKGYKIKYLSQVEVYVKNPDNKKDWFNQKVRNIKGHENLNKIAPDMPRTKSFFNELKNASSIFTYPKNFTEFCWLINLCIARLQVYKKAFKDINQNKKYSDGWREVETKSTRTLD